MEKDTKGTTITLCTECFEKDPKLTYPDGTDYELRYPDYSCPTCGWKPTFDSVVTMMDKS